MRTTRGWTGPRLALAALGLCASMVRGVEADTMDSTATTPANPPVASTMDYFTSGRIDPVGITGQNVINFSSINDQPISAPSNLSLGQFVLNWQPTGQVVTYHNTPFEIDLVPKSIDGKAVSGDQMLKLTGVLNGSVVGSTNSSVVATFNPIANPNLTTGSVVDQFSFTTTSLFLSPYSSNFGHNSIQAHVDTFAAPVPEPTSVAVFLAALGGLGLRRIRRGRLS